MSRCRGVAMIVVIGCCLGCGGGEVAEKQAPAPEAESKGVGLRATYIHHDRAHKAMQRGDHEAAKQELSRALDFAPAHPALLALMARVEALLGEHEASLTGLQQLATIGATIDVTADDAFAEVIGLPGFAEVAAQLAVNGQAQQPAEVVVTLEDPELWSEGIAYDPVSGDLFVGSIKRKKIVRVRGDGIVGDFGTSAADGLLGLLGMEVDRRRRHLWACTGTGSDELFTDGERRQNAVVQYDLETEQLVAVYPLVDDGRNRLINDLTIGPDGTVYVTESNHGALYQVIPGDSEVRLYRELPEFNYLNGITISGDGSLLWVAAVEGIVAIELASGEVHRVQHGDEVTTVGADGLRAVGSSLIAVQNQPKLNHRVVRFFLDASGLQVTRHEVLAVGLPEGLIPYTCAIGDGVVYVNGTSTFDLFDRGEIPPNPVVVRVPL